jgi:hypothetical protein
MPLFTSAHLNVASTAIVPIKVANYCLPVLGRAAGKRLSVSLGASPSLFTKQRWLQFHFVFLRRITIICITIINSRIKQNTASHVNNGATGNDIEAAPIPDMEGR